MYKDDKGIWQFWYGLGTEAEALDEGRRVKADLLAGRAPSLAGNAVTVAAVCNKFVETTSGGIATSKEPATEVANGW